MTFRFLIGLVRSLSELNAVDKTTLPDELKGEETNDSVLHDPRDVCFEERETPKIFQLAAPLLYLRVARST